MIVRAEVVVRLGSVLFWNIIKKGGSVFKNVESALKSIEIATKSANHS